MIERIYIYGQKGRAKKAHIARYRPSGYGVAALCGKSWREGDYGYSYDNHSGEVCRTCDNKRENAR